MKIVLNGIPGTGKTTIAALLSKALNLPFVTERFENNPYLKPGSCAPAWKISNYQQCTMIEDYENNASGVFEVSPDAGRAIFVPGEEHQLMEKLPGLVYDFKFALVADYYIIRDRIIKRNREGLLETELNCHQERYARYIEWLPNSGSIPINAQQTPDEIVNEIIRYINNSN